MMADKAQLMKNGIVFIRNGKVEDCLKEYMLYLRYMV